MAVLTPFATPAGGFPLRLSTQRSDGSNAVVTFPTSAGVNPNDAPAEAEFKKVVLLNAGGTFSPACT